MRSDIRYYNNNMEYIYSKELENKSTAIVNADKNLATNNQRTPTHDISQNYSNFTKSMPGQQQNYQSYHFQKTMINQNNLLERSKSSKYSETKIDYQSFKYMKNQEKINICQNCAKIQIEKQTIVNFMKEQIQISSKQYKEKMNRILKDQAKKIIQLKQSLAKNQQNLSLFQKNCKNFISNQKSVNLDFSCHSNRQNKHQKIQKVSPLRIQKKSPSKLSLTKSSSNISIHQQKSKNAKISMLSKQLSPAKTNKNVYNEKDKIDTTVASSQINLNELIKKIKEVQKKLAQTFQYQNERTQKFQIFNKHLELVEIGLLKLFACKIKKSEQTLSNFMIFQQNKIKMIQQDLIKCINLTKSQYLQKSEYSHSQNNLQKINSGEEFNKKLKSVKLQIEQIRQISKQIQTKQFKYDNFQVQELVSFFKQLKRKVQNLNKQKQQMMKLNLIISNNNNNNNLASTSSLKYQKNPENNFLNQNQKQKEFLKNFQRSKIIQSKSRIPQKSNRNQSHHFNSNSNSHISSSSFLTLSNNLLQIDSLKRKQLMNRAVQQNLQYLSKTTMLNKKKEASNISQNYYRNQNQFQNSAYQNGPKLNQNNFSIDYFIDQSHYPGQKSSYSYISNEENSLIENNYQQPSFNCDKSGYMNEQGQNSFNSEQQNDQSQIQCQQKGDFNVANQDDDQFFYPDYQNQQSQFYEQTENYKNYKNQLGQSKNIQRFIDIFKYRNVLQQQGSQNEQDRNLNEQYSINSNRIIKAYDNDEKINTSQFSSSKLSMRKDKNTDKKNSHKYKPIQVQIDQTGYVKCSQNGMYIVDRNGDGFQLQQEQIKYLLKNGFICI